MLEKILSIWTVQPISDGQSLIIPDGCCDLIMSCAEGGKPEWKISSLFEQAEFVPLKAGKIMQGFRMKAGLRVNKTALLNSLKDQNLTTEDVLSRLDDYSFGKTAVDEILEYFSENTRGITLAAKELGTSPRTLQRLLLKETGKSPLFWMKLARARRAARALFDSTSDAEISEIYGFADQPHMCREVKAHFGLNPTALKKSKSIFRQLQGRAYA